MLNKNLQSAIDKVMTRADPALETFEVTVYSDSDLAYRYSPLFIRKFTIAQRFDSEYADSITLVFPLSIRDYVQIFDRQRGLNVVITRKQLLYDGSKSEVPPVISRYYALIENPRDFSRQVTDADKRVQMDVEIRLNLIEKDIYIHRHVKANGITRDCTVTTLMRSILKQVFDMGNVDIYPADNTFTYKQAIIPPALGLSEFLYYVQNTWGVYMSGFAHYYHDGKMYIFPSYETKPQQTNQVINFYAAEVGSYAGAPSFHRETSNGADIVLSAKMTTEDMTIRSAENAGTSRMFLKYSQIADGFVKKDGGNITIDPRSAVSIDNLRAKTVIGESRNNVYSQPTDNPFALSSSMMKDQAVIVDTAWAMAVPFLIKPRAAIQYAYDLNGQFTTQTGIVDSIVYDYTEVSQNPGEGRAYACMANVRLRLSPDIVQ